MTKWREFYDSSFLKPEALTEQGATVTIATVDPGEVEQEDGPEVKHQAVVTFKETKTKWGVNVINRHLIEALFGDEIEDAVGHRITLFQTPCEVAGKFKDKPSVRVKGSPELKKTLAVTIKLPKRKPFTRTLVPTGKPQSPPPSTSIGQNGDAVPQAAPSTPASVDVAETEDSGGYWPEPVDEPAPDTAAAAEFLASAEKANAARFTEPHAEHPGGITTQQMRALNVQWRKLADAGWSEEQLRALLLRETGKLSRKALTMGEASAAVKALALEVQSV